MIDHKKARAALNHMVNCDRDAARLAEEVGSILLETLEVLGLIEDMHRSFGSAQVRTPTNNLDYAYWTAIEAILRGDL